MRLSFLCVGTGRDGTLSLTDMVQDMFDRSGDGRKAMHEYRARYFYNAFANYQESNDPQYLVQLRSYIEDCPYDCIVGNGYAAVLPLFSEIAGPNLTLIHLRRDNRAACIESLKNDCELFPAAYRYYSSAPEAEMKRMAAFHFGEMTQAAWDALSLDEKIAWYYDKTHELIRSSSALFAQCVEITTELIDDANTRRTLAHIVTGNEELLPPPTHLNAHRIDIAGLPSDRRPKMQWLMGRLNLHRLAYDDVYAIDYFLEKFVAWTSYQIQRSPVVDPFDLRSPEEIATTIDRARQVIAHRLREVESLESLLKTMTPP